MIHDAAINKALDEYEAQVRDAERYRRLRESGVFSSDESLLIGKALDDFADALVFLFPLEVPR